MKEGESFEDTIDLEVDGRSTLRAYRRPSRQGAASWRAVDVPPRWDGWMHRPLHEIASAAAGYVTVVPNFYHPHRPRMCRCTTARNSSRTARSSAKSPPLRIMRSGRRILIAAASSSWGHWYGRPARVSGRQHETGIHRGYRLLQRWNDEPLGRGSAHAIRCHGLHSMPGLRIFGEPGYLSLASGRSSLRSGACAPRYSPHLPSLSEGRPRFPDPAASAQS